MTKLREKWISAHPIPPQDLTTFPERKLTEEFDEFRRRPEPHYDVFSDPLPGATDEYRVEAIGGITYVFKNNKSDEDDALPPSLGSNPKDSVFHVGSFQEFVDDFHFVSVYLID